MKTMLLLASIYHFIPALEAKQDQEFTKSFAEEFDDVSADALISVKSKAGDVTFKNWDQNKVKITATVKAITRSKSLGKRLLENISVSFSTSDGNINAETVFHDKAPNWAKKNVDLSIDYEVFLPATNRVDVSLGHGNVFIEEIMGEVSLNLYRANFTANRFGGKATIVLNHGKGTLNFGKHIKSDLKHAHLSVKEVELAEMEIVHSTFKVEKGLNILSNAEFGKFLFGTVSDYTNSGFGNTIDIQSAERIKVAGKHAKIKVVNIGEALDLDMEHGGCDVGLSSNAFDVNLIGNHTAVVIGVGADAQFKMDATAEYGNISYPEGMEIQQLIESKMNQKVVVGYFGQKETDNIVKARLSGAGKLKVKRI